MTDEQPIYLREPRDELQGRFTTLSAKLLRIRDLIPHCDRDRCDVCRLLGEPVPMPASVLAREHGPREDLEQAVEAVGARLLAVAQHRDAALCPAGRDAVQFYVDCERALEAEAGDEDR